MTDDDVKKEYRYWRHRVMTAMVVGYAVFYFVRKNISMAAKSITDEYGFTNTEWGLVLSSATIVYAVSKFLSGVMADRFNPKYLMSFGLVASALINLTYGLGTGLLFFVVVWSINSLFQGMGMPPCSRLLTSWFSHKELGRSWGIWNASHQIGGAIILIWAGYLVQEYGWRTAFWVPGLLAFVVSFWLFWRLTDTPESQGLPSIEVFSGETVTKPETELGFWPTMERYILRNPWVWLVSVANFFIYIVRIGVLDWAPKFLEEAKGFNIMEAGVVVAAFELAGIFGAYACGYLSDGPFKGYRGRVAVLFMGLLILSVVAIFFIPEGAIYWMSLGFIAVGFFVYGPQMLVAVAAADFATRAAAATAVGLTGLFGYMGATVCGVVTGYLVDHYGWNAALYFYLGSAIVGTALLILTWNQSLQKPETQKKPG